MSDDLVKVMVAIVGGQIFGSLLTIAAIRVEMRWLRSDVNRAHRRLDKVKAPDCMPAEDVC